MFCHKCGNKSLEGAVFCQKCGAKLIVDNTAQQPMEIPMSTATVKPSEPAPTQTPVMPVSTVVQKESAHRDSAVSSQVNDNNEVLKVLIGKNSDYYLKHFAKIDRNEKSFNWLAFFFAPIILLYRKQYSYFLKLPLPVCILLFILNLLSGYAVATFDFELMMEMPKIAGIIIVYAISAAIFCGIGFNKQYKSNLQKVIAENKFTPNNINDPSNIERVKKIKPSAFIPITFVILYMVFSYVFSFAIGTIVVKNLTDSAASNTQNVEEFPTKNNTGTVTKSVSNLTANEAKELLQKWLNNHPLPDGTYLDGEVFTHKLDGKEYYAILLRGMPSNITSRAVDIFIDPKTGELFQSSSLEPLDKWYRRIIAQIDQKANQSDVTYNGQPVSMFLGRSQNEIVNVFGQPGKSSPASITYADGTEFKFSNGNCIGIWSSNLSAFNIKGTSLQKNRDELISILGTPAFDGRENNLYRLRYHLANGAILRFAMQNPGNKAEYIAVVKE